MTRIAVVTGGSTPERDVAFAGAAQVVAALRARGHEVTTIDSASGEMSRTAEARYLVSSVPTRPPSHEALRVLAASELRAALVTLPAVRDADLVFPVLHGRQGEGGELQSLLELAGIPYAGSGPLGSAIAMDKDIAKRLFRAAGVATADWAMWPAGPTELAGLGLPLIVKPVNVGSTVGLTVVQSLDEIEDAVALAQGYDAAVMFEAFVPGREFTVGVLGERALAVGEIIPQHDIFDYECKYTPGMAREIFPADIPPKLTTRLQDQALAVHRALKLRDFSRIDFRIAEDGVPLCLEANTLPGLTGTSLLPQSAAAAGIDFATLCDTIRKLALARRGSRNKVRS
ncbi:MAG TPA: D-alanine--D-alanine ligase [Gemmatimonadales bacterium]